MSKPRVKSTSKSRDRKSRENHVDESSEQYLPLACSIISKKESEELLKMTANEMERKLEEKFHLDTENLKDAAVLDYYVGAIYWGQQQGYNQQQLSTLFTIVYNLLNKIRDERASLVNLIVEFQGMLVRIGTDSKVQEDLIFSTQQAKAVTDYISLCLFQHYKLYLHMLTVPQDVTVITNNLSVEAPIPFDAPFPRSLDEGLPEEIFTQFLTFSTPPSAQDAASTDEDQMAMKSLEMDLPSKVTEILGKLTPEDVKLIINETCAAVLNNLQSTMESKIKKHEVATYAKLDEARDVISSQ